MTHSKTRMFFHIFFHIFFSLVEIYSRGNILSLNYFRRDKGAFVSGPEIDLRYEKTADDALIFLSR